MKKTKTSQNIVESENNNELSSSDFRNYIKSCVLEELENLSKSRSKITKKKEVVFDEIPINNKTKQKTETITCKCGKSELRPNQMNMHLNSSYHKNNI